MASRERFDLSAARVVRGTTVSGAEDDEGCCSGRVESRSFPFPLPLGLDFCFAALTLALERKALASAEAAEDESWSGNCGLVAVDALALLVASGCWIGCKSI